MSPRCRPSSIDITFALTLVAASLGETTPLLAQGARGTSNADGQGASASARNNGRPSAKARAPKGNGAARKGASADAAPKPGIFPVVPPFSTMIANGDTISLDTNGITLKKKSNAAKLRIGGRIEVDGSNADVYPDLPGPTLRDDFDIRRAWLEAYLTLYDAAELAFQYDFNDPVNSIQDAAFGYRGFDPFIFTIGNVKEPFGLNQPESDKITTFVERASTDSLAPGRDFGGTVGANIDKWTIAAGVFGGNINTGVDDNGVAGTARLTYAPILTDDQLLHLGVAGSYRALGETPFSLSTRPENSLFSTPLVSTGMLAGADDVLRFGLEALYQYRSYRVQAEYAFADVGSVRGQGDRFFHSGYVEVAAVLNGNGRPYRLAPTYGAEYAVLEGVKVNDAQRISRGGIGVFEVAARYSAIDFQDGSLAGGKQQDFTAGLNWYPDANIKLMANYIHADADPAAGRLLQGRDAYSDAFLGRIQISW